jgi:hypothetical protein
MRLAYDLTLRRPACAILAAALGGDVALVHAFNAENWLIHPTPDMKVYNITSEQLALLLDREEAIDG